MINPKAISQSAFSGLIGVSRRDITPPAGIYMGNWGAATKHYASGVHKPLALKCITFKGRNGSLQLVLISCDLGWWKNDEDEKELRNKILTALSLKEEQLLFCLTHTHAGPGLSTRDIEKTGGELIPEYLNQLAIKSISAIQEAFENEAGAVLAWNYSRCNLAVNRDLQYGEKFVVGYNPSEKADDTLLIGRITDLSGEILATIVNYACHPTTLAWKNELISPDFAGAMYEIVEAHTTAPCMFLQGASGELSPPEQYSGDTSLADQYGKQLGYAVISGVEAMLPPGKVLSFIGAVESGASLGIWEKTEQMPPQQLLAEKVMIEIPLKSLPALEEIRDELLKSSGPVERERLQRKYGIRKAVGDGTSASIPLWIWRIGSSILLAQPNEAYSNLQTELRTHFPDNHICVINVANGHIGYLAPRKLYKENIYSVWQSPFDTGSLEKLIESAIHHSEIIMNQ